MLPPHIPLDALRGGFRSCKEASAYVDESVSAVLVEAERAHRRLACGAESGIWVAGMPIARPRREAEATADRLGAARQRLRPEPARVVLELPELRAASDGGDAVSGRRAAVGAGAVPEPRIEGEGGAR